MTDNRNSTSMRTDIRTTCRMNCTLAAPRWPNWSTVLGQPATGRRHRRQRHVCSARTRRSEVVLRAGDAVLLFQPIVGG